MTNYLARNCICHSERSEESSEILRFAQNDIYSNPKSFMQICRGGAKSARPLRGIGQPRGVGVGLPLQEL